jgi:hypothetical protein
MRSILPVIGRTPYKDKEKGKDFYGPALFSLYVHLFYSTSKLPL